MSSTRQQDLAERAKHSARFSIFASASSAVLQLLQVAILARLLKPAEFAAAAVATIVVGLLSRVADFGLSSAVIHFQNSTHKQLSTLYVFNLIVGSLLSLAVMAAAPLASKFYGSPELSSVFLVLGPSIALFAAGAQFGALHQKTLNFGIVALSDIASGVATLIVAVVCALKGLGAVSIAWGAVGAATARTAILASTGLRLHTPDLALDWKGTWKFMRFGAYQAAEYMLDFLNMQMDSLVLGKFGGMATLGLYAPIKILCSKPVSLINPILTRVAFPVMSMVQQDLPRVARIYLLQIRTVASFSLPIYAFSFIAAEPIISVLFGQKWGAAVPALRFLSIWGALISVGNPVGSLLLATGHVKRSFIWNIAAACFTLPCVTLASRYGATWIAATLAGVQLVLFVPGWRILIWPACGAQFLVYCGAIARPLAPAILACLPAWLVCDFSHHPIIRLLVAGAVYACGYVALSWFFNQETFRLLLNMVARRKNMLASHPK